MQAPGLTSHARVHLISDDYMLGEFLCKLKDKLFSNPFFPCKMFKLKCVTGVWGNTIFKEISPGQTEEESLDQGLPWKIQTGGCA